MRRPSPSALAFSSSYSARSTCSPARKVVSPGSSISCPFGTTAVSVSASNNGVAFSSATNIQITVTNFGVKLFLDRFVELAPPPGAIETVDDGVVCPDAEEFSGFVFKIQANMDPLHRDRVAFLRVCSGRFERDMQVFHPRLGKKIRLTRPHKLFAQGRETIEEAYAGDIIGLTNPGLFAIGDTVSSVRPVTFGSIPRFAPEHFASLQNRHLEKYKQFQKGLEQLGEEGAIQVLYPLDSARREPILAAVGQLQFEVVQFRLRHEYGVETSLMRLPFELASWLNGPADDLRRITWAPGARAAEDPGGRLVGLFDGQWAFDYTREKNPTLQFHDTAPLAPGVGCRV